MKDPLENYRSFVKADPFPALRNIQSAVDRLQDLSTLHARLADPFPALRNIQSAVDRLQDLSTLHARLADPFPALRNIQSAVDRLQDLSTLHARLADPFPALRNIQSAVDRLQDLSTLRDRLADPFPDSLRNIQSAIDRLQDHTQLDNLLKTSVQFSDPLKGFRELQLSVERLQPIFESVERQVSVGRDGTITLETLNLDQSELQEICDQVLEQALVNHPIGRLEGIVQKIIEEIRGLKNSPLEKTLLIITILIQFTFSIINPITDYYIKDFLSANKRETKKYINQQVHASFENKDILGAFRYVAADTLNVRLKGSKQSPSIGTLRFGDVVVLLKKGRHWSLVEWQDREGQATIRGWVFSRYLEKFK